MGSYEYSEAMAATDWSFAIAPDTSHTTSITLSQPWI